MKTRIEELGPTWGEYAWLVMIVSVFGMAMGWRFM
jgi:hypothetical protein